MTKFDPKTYAGPVTAIATGFYGRKRRDPGENFSVKAGEFSTVWMKVGAPKATAPAEPGPKAGTEGGEGGDSINGDGTSQVRLDANVVEIDPEWKKLHYTKRLALAKLISGIEPEDTAKADAIIQAEVENRDAKARAATTIPPV